MKQGFLIALIVLGIIALLLLIIIAPLRFRIMGHIDLLHNHLYFSVRLFGISVFSGSIKIRGNRMFFTSGRGKEKSINKSGNDKENEKEGNIKNDKKNDKEISLKLIAPAYDEESIASYIPSYMPDIKLIKLNLYMQIGKSDDAFFTALSTGIVKTALLSLFGVLRMKHPDMMLDYEFESLYNLDHLQITFNCILNINIADIIYTVYRSLSYHKAITKKGAKKNGRNKQPQ